MRDSRIGQAIAYALMALILRFIWLAVVSSLKAADDPKPVLCRVACERAAGCPCGPGCDCTAGRNCGSADCPASKVTTVSHNGLTVTLRPGERLLSVGGVPYPTPRELPTGPALPGPVMTLPMPAARPAFGWPQPSGGCRIINGRMVCPRR